MIDRDQIVATIQAVLAQKCLTARSLDAVDAPLDLDSLARLTLIVELENAFQVELMEGAEPAVFHTIASLSDFVARAVQEGPPS